MNIYNSPLDVLPLDASTVWIRVYDQYAPAVQAVFTLSTMQFLTITTSVIIPVYFVSRWRNL